MRPILVHIAHPAKRGQVRRNGHRRHRAKTTPGRDFAISWPQTWPQWPQTKQGRKVMKRMLLLGTMLGALPGLWCPTLGLAQTMEELLADGKNTDNVLNHSMGLDRKSYSPLKLINKSNVKRLVPIWSTSLMNDWGELSAPTVYNGVIYAINGKFTFAIDVETGRQLWRTAVEAEPGVDRHGITRGAPVLYNGKLFRVTVDNHLVALDMKTGKEVWKQKFAEAKEGYYATGGPILANCVLISRMSGGVSTTCGF